MSDLSEIMKAIEAENGSVKDLRDRLENLEAKSNRPSAGGETVSDGWPTTRQMSEAFRHFKDRDFEGRFEFKNVTSDGSGLGVPALLQPLAMTASTRSVFLADRLPSRIVDGPAVALNRIGSTDLAGVQPNQGDQKHELEVETDSSTVTLSTIASFAKVSTQALQDVADLQNILQGVLTLRLKRKVDTLLYAAASATGNFTPYESTSPTIVDNLVGANAALADYGLTGTTFVSPADYARLMLTKASTAGLFLGLPQYANLDIQQASVVPAGRFLLTTTDGVGLSLAVRSVILAVLGFVGDDFTRNLRTLLVEQRVAPLVTDPGRVIIGDLVATS